MKPKHTFYPELPKPKREIWPQVLRVTYIVACFTVFILIWTGL
jgi:hypothetical protein